MVEHKTMGGLLCLACARKRTVECGGQIDYEKAWRDSDISIAPEFCDEHDNCDDCGKNVVDVGSHLCSVGIRVKMHYISRANKMKFFHEIAG